MYLVNILLTTGLILLISCITVLSICAAISTPRPNQNSSFKPFDRNNKERRKNKARNFPITCTDGTMVYFDRRLQSDSGCA